MIEATWYTGGGDGVSLTAVIVGTAVAALVAAWRYFKGRN